MFGVFFLLSVLIPSLTILDPGFGALDILHLGNDSGVVAFSLVMFVICTLVKVILIFGTTLIVVDTS